jgi:hypothetical protein
MKVSVFFEFSSKLRMSTFQAGPVGLQKDKNGTYAHHNLIKGHYEEIEFPVVFKQDSGKNLTDILDTGHVSLFLISDRMKVILEENHLTGWKVFPIQLYDKKGNEIHGYHGFSFTGQCAPIDFEKSEIIEKIFIPHGPLYPYYKGVVVDDWDGSDFFTPKGTYETLVTKNAADILKKAKITNLELTNLADFEINMNDARPKQPRRPAK